MAKKPYTTPKKAVIDPIENNDPVVKDDTPIVATEVSDVMTPPPSEEVPEVVVEPVVKDDTPIVVDEPAPVEPVVEESAPVETAPVVAPATPVVEVVVKDASAGTEASRTATGIDVAGKASEVALRLEAQNKWGRGVIGWPAKDCKRYLEENVLPPKTTRDNWVRDVNRVKDLSAWTLSECIDFVDGQLELDARLDVDLVWEEIYRRYRVAGSATRKDVKALVLKDTPIPMTDSGQLVNSTTRDAKSVDTWTYADIRGALLGHYKSQHSKEDLVKALKNILGVSDNYDTNRLLDSLIEERNSSMADMLLIAKLEEFKKARMNTGAFVKPTTHGDAHAVFFRTVKKLLSREYREFKEGWTIVLDFVKREENTIFTMKRRYEHWNQVPLSGADLRAAEDLINLLTATADPALRNRATNLAMIKGLTQHLCTETDMEKLFTFYTPS